MTLPPLGLDLAELKFNACLVRDSGKLRHKVFPNTAAGFAQLAGRLAARGVRRVHACMEATGAYGDSPATYLHEAGHAVGRVNPAAVKAYARGHPSRTRNGRVDAALIAGSCSERRPPAWRPPAPEPRELQALARRLGSLVGMRTMEENRLSSGISVEAARESAEGHIAYLAERIERTGKLIRDHVGKHPGLRRRSESLDSIPGVGEAAAAALPAEVPDTKQDKSAREVAAFAGPVPRERQSGSRVRGRVRLPKIGDARLRKAPYSPAVTAIGCGPFFQEWAEGLRQRAKSKVAVIGAVMRKLVHLAYGVPKTGHPFDPKWAKRA